MAHAALDLPGESVVEDTSYVLSGMKASMEVFLVMKCDLYISHPFGQLKISEQIFKII